MKFLLSLFNELIFTRKEEYDFKSKHFKLAKVIFALVIFLLCIYSFFVTSAFFRVAVKYMNLTEQHTILQTSKQGACVITPDKNQVKGPSDSQKLSMEYKNE